MIDTEIERIASELRAEIDRDVFDMSFVAESVREDLNLHDQSDIRFYTLDVIRRLMMRDIYPGDYNYAATISFWPGEPGALLKRIEEEWTAMGKTPTSVEPICWFGLKPSKPA